MELPDRDKFLQDVEAFLEKHQMRHTVFGEKVMKNPAMMTHYRSGRCPNLETAKKIYDWMAEYDEIMNMTKL